MEVEESREKESSSGAAAVVVVATADEAAAVTDYDSDYKTKHPQSGGSAPCEHTLYWQHDHKPTSSGCAAKKIIRQQ